MYVYVYVYVYVCVYVRMRMRVHVHVWCPENVKVFEWTILRSSVMNMITQIIYLGRAEVGDWQHAVFFKNIFFNGFYGSLDLDILTWT